MERLQVREKSQTCMATYGDFEETSLLLPGLAVQDLVHILPWLMLA